MSVVVQILVIFGSLGVFLYGMRLMSEGLQRATGPRLKRVLGYMTSNRIAGVISGFATTAVVQSSSATTVMVVGLVDASLLTLRQAIGVIMGANIGTTVTGWIVALLGFKFSITTAALPAIALGTAIKFIKRIDREDVAEMLIGFGFLFLGLDLLKGSVPDIRNNPEVLEFLTRFTGYGFGSFLIFILAGALLTIAVQSSSAAMAITLTMTFSGWIDYETSAAIILGENIGTTVTAYLASLNSTLNARKAARAHTLFNLLGVVWMALLFRPFLSLVDIMVPGDATGRLEITAHLAMFHSLFNITNTLLFIGFVGHFERVVDRLVRTRPTDRPEAYHFRYVRNPIHETTEIYVAAAQSEVGKLSGIVEELYGYFLELFQHPSKSIRSELPKYRDKVELVAEMQVQITEYLVECSKDANSDDEAHLINGLVRISTELESIGDTCGKLIRLANEKLASKIRTNDETFEAIGPFSRMVEEFLAFNTAHISGTLTEAEYRQAEEYESMINARQKELKKAARKRIRKGGSVKGELYYIDVLRHIEHIGDFSLAVAEVLVRLGSGALRKVPSSKSGTEE